MLLPICAIALSVLGLVAAASEHRKEDRLANTSNLGGPHGKGFDDFGFVNAQSGHRRISKVTIGPCENDALLTYIKFEYKDWSQPALSVTSVYHGSIAGGRRIMSIDLHDGEYIDTVGVRTAKVHVGKKWKTRVSGLGISTSNGQTIGCGEQGDKAHDIWYQKNRAFLYFSGAAGDALDNFQGHLIPKEDY